ncbi:30S ribosomal protein S4 [bacterium Unc6]|nr:30S ribosomal protein S4 [bacterium Unc6]
MSRYTGPSCRLCRREGIKLFLKTSRCTTGKCAFDRRQYIPGQHGKKGKSKLSNYGLQLREKQKLKRLYGIGETQFKNYFLKAAKKRGITGVMLLQQLETRLDNVIFRACFSGTRGEARQIVRHGFVVVNDQKVNIPSFLVKPGDRFKIVGKENVINKVKQTAEIVKSRGVPSWLNVHLDTLEGEVSRPPDRADIQVPVNEQTIVELYSK